MPACLVTKNDRLQIHTIRLLLCLFRSHKEFLINSMLCIHLWQPQIPNTPPLWVCSLKRKESKENVNRHSQHMWWQEGQRFPEFWKQRHSPRSPLGTPALLLRSWCLIQRNDGVSKVLTKSKETTNIKAVGKATVAQKKKDADTVNPLHCTDKKKIIFKNNTVRLPWYSEGKESACNVGDLGLIPGSGRSSGKGNGNPLQCSCLENSMDRGTWKATRG